MFAGQYLNKKAAPIVRLLHFGIRCLIRDPCQFFKIRWEGFGGAFGVVNADRYAFDRHQ